jgi:AMP deaminase
MTYYFRFTPSNFYLSVIFTWALNKVNCFLIQVVGFDIVDDESKPERRPTKHMPTPAEWTNEFNPAFSYYAYYCYANLYILNKVLL